MEEQEQEQTLPLHKRIIKSKAFLPAVIFLFAVILFSISSRFSDRIPVLDSITPEVSYPGDVLVISGRYFGKSRQGSEVTIVGLRLPSSLYLEWQENRISFVVPKDAGSGPLVVTTRNGRSNSLIFTNRNHIPVVLEGPAQPGFPYVKSISPTTGSSGTLITLTGQNFGMEKGNGRVQFTSLSPADTQVMVSPQPSTIDALDLDYDYESWTDQEIQVRLPDGASSGSMLVYTEQGPSNGYYFEVTEPVGTKILRQKRGYQLQYGITVRNVSAAGAGSGLYLWMPQVYSGLEQRNMELNSQPSPLWNTYPGLLVYYFENMKSGYEYSVSQTFWFERYAIESRINPEKIPAEPYDKGRKLFTVFTAPDEFVPSGDPGIQALAKTLTGRDKNPYIIAWRIYNYLIANFLIDKTPVFNSAVSTLEAKKGDSYTISLLFSALLRSAGIPARPVAGYIVYGNRIPVKHYWAEFYIQNYGWVPVDVSLGSGLRWAGFPDLSGTGNQNPGEFYFGSLDNQHIVISRGILPTVSINPSGITARKPRHHSFQTINEESISLASYSSVWSDANIVEWW
ncbi:MAG: transglutaminase [Spirochaetales bacterium]|nr:MAG: transglutaminase [Spirochaetales bacterium]